MIKGKNYTVHIGNNLDILPTLESNSVDSIVTDPPYELGFMGKKWDSSGIAYNVELWRECLRVLKPGGHMLAFGGTRTWHRIAVAIEDAGFEVRDSIAWMYGSGFPKSLSVSKAIESTLVNGSSHSTALRKTEQDGDGATYQMSGRNNGILGEPRVYDRKEFAPATPEAKQWEGWGTALKPAFEPVIVARKPLIGTVAENVLTYGTGGLNIDGSRIGTETVGWQGAGRSGDSATAGASQGGEQGGYNYGDGQARPVQGRWPANIILDPYTAELLDEQSGVRASGAFPKSATKKAGEHYAGGWQIQEKEERVTLDSGGASRFFYVAKASKRDRNEGLEELEAKSAEKGHGRNPDSAGAKNPRAGIGGGSATAAGNASRQNFHPTVKPTTLMEYLIKLVTPPNGLVLDPFTGSGSTGKAALLNGFRFVGCELTEDYIPIIEGRLNHAEAMAEQAKEKKDEALF